MIPLNDGLLKEESNVTNTKIYSKESSAVINHETQQLTNTVTQKKKKQKTV